MIPAANRLSCVCVAASLLMGMSLWGAEGDPDQAAEPALRYTCTYLGNTNQDDRDGSPYQIVPGWITDVAVAADGTVFMGGGAEANGVAAFRYDAATKRVQVVGRYGRGSVGTPQSGAVALDGEYLFSANEPASGGLRRYGFLPPGSPVTSPATASPDSGFDLSLPSPWTPGKKDWSVRWEGSIVPDRDGLHRLALRYGAGARLWLDGKLIFDDWKDAYRRWRYTPDIQFKRGAAIPIVIEFFATDSAGCVFQLMWMKPDGDPTPVPPGSLRTPTGGPGLKGSYFADRELSQPAFIRDDAFLHVRNWSGASMSGLERHGGQLYVADETLGRIRVFNASTRAEERAWNLDFVPGKIVIDRNPAGPYLWVADQSGAAIRSFTLEGEPRPAATIAGIAIPGGLAIDLRGHLLVGDCGPDHWVLRYDIGSVTKAPKRLDAFGAQGGVWSGKKPGTMGPQRFCKPVGLDVDAQGRLYVACNFGITGTSNTSIECYEPDGQRLWWIYAFPYCDGAVLDPLDERTVYTSRGRFRADWSKPVGQEFTWEALTYERTNRMEYADARYKAFVMPVAARVMHGKTFLFMTTQMSREPSWIYRIDGDTVVPAAFHSACAGGGFKDAPGGESRPPKNPIGRNETTKSSNWGSLRWTDLDGDGSWEGDWDVAKPGCEFSNVELGFAEVTGTVDGTGALWFHRTRSEKRVKTFSLHRARCIGVNAIGAPVYAETLDDFSSKLPSLSAVRAIEYDASSDVMYVMGETAPDELHLYRYDHFTTEPKLAWQSGRLPVNDSSFTPKTAYGAGMPKFHKVAGDHVFVPYGYGGWVRVYRTADGAFLGTMKPTGISGNKEGELDANHGLTVQRLRSGEYIIFVESAGLARVTVYRWRP